jgi:hypothetical protein
MIGAGVTNGPGLHRGLRRGKLCFPQRPRMMQLDDDTAEAVPADLEALKNQLEQLHEGMKVDPDPAASEADEK